MGKRIETKQILQVGKKNNNYIWDSKYFEKHRNEAQIYLSQSLEIEKFFKIFFQKFNLQLYKYNILFSESTLKIFVSYFKKAKIKNVISKINITDQLKLRKKKYIRKKKPHLHLYKNILYKRIKKKNFKKTKFLKSVLFYRFCNFFSIYRKQFLVLKKRLKIYFKDFYFKQKFKKILNKNLFFVKFNYILNKVYFPYLQKIQFNVLLRHKLKFFYYKYLIKQFILNYIHTIKLKKILTIKYQNYFKNFLILCYNYKKLFKILLLNKKLYKKRLKTLEYYKNYVKMSNNKTLKNLQMNNFLKNCNESLKLFTKNKFFSSLILQQINKNITFNFTYRQIHFIKKLVINLRQFKNAKFFNEGVNVILLSLLNPKKTNLLVDFIAFQLKFLKRHGIFFKFLVKIFSVLLSYKFIKVKSIKILFKGRINGKPRASKKLIFINKYMSLMTINSSVIFNQSTASNLTGSFGVKLWVNTY